MNRETELALLDGALRRTREKQRPALGPETRIPVDHYLGAARFEREQERVFRPALHCVTLSSALPRPGSFLTTDVMGRPVLLARGPEGRLRAFLNVCRHRGATVELRERGRCSRFVCPYHAWTYRTDGALDRVRHPDGFPTLDPASHGLVELACDEVAGLVFVCPTPGATPERLPAALAEELSGIAGAHPTVYARTVRTWQANWKLVVEGGLESYHFAIAHRRTIAPFFTDTLSTWQPIGRHIRSVLPRRSILQLAEQPRSRWRLRDHTHLVYLIHPTLILLVQHDHFDLIRLMPLSAGVCQLEILTVGEGTAEGGMDPARASHLEKNHAISVSTLDEDFRIAEQIQRGIESGANSHFRFGRFEDALTAWHQGVEEELSSGDAEGLSSGDAEEL